MNKKVLKLLTLLCLTLFLGAAFFQCSTNPDGSGGTSNDKKDDDKKKKKDGEDGKDEKSITLTFVNKTGAAIEELSFYSITAPITCSWILAEDEVIAADQSQAYKTYNGKYQIVYKLEDDIEMYYIPLKSYDSNQTIDLTTENTLPDISLTIDNQTGEKITYLEIEDNIIIESPVELNSGNTKAAGSYKAGLFFTSFITESGAGEIPDTYYETDSTIRITAADVSKIGFTFNNQTGEEITNLTLEKLNDDSMVEYLILDKELGDDPLADGDSANSIYEPGYYSIYFETATGAGRIAEANYPVNTTINLTADDISQFITLTFDNQTDEPITYLELADDNNTSLIILDTKKYGDDPLGVNEQFIYEKIPAGTYQIVFNTEYSSSCLEFATYDSNETIVLSFEDNGEGNNNGSSEIYFQINNQTGFTINHLEFRSDSGSSYIYVDESNPLEDQFIMSAGSFPSGIYQVIYRLEDGTESVIPFTEYTSDIELILE